MDRYKSLSQQIRTYFADVEAMPEFADKRLWLTFYLSGPLLNLESVSHFLAREGWANTDGWDFGFLYPKLEVEKTVPAIVAVAVKMHDLCRPYGIDIINIDADTSPDVTTSKFVTLYDADL
ncbi:MULTISPECIES: hypothetical protein [unclassified Sphingobium]|uniref:hypothetical protein n=1 Tax=unclassified Sphingobium TaxID=2611147 RepID=UPI0022257E36|nr:MULTISPECIES: hypothetical protein [unclassified Sphingobium]MCW2410876.1 hypothetical protein [Sphingobium sp. B8D3D]MCW2416834.1 hypothetical protein [Sphingobium sp. B8D3A]